MSKDYSVKVTIRNGRILARMREMGIPNQTALAQAAGISVAQVNDIVTLRRAPAKQNGDWASSVYAIAGALNCEPEDLFTERQKTLAIQQNSHEIYMDEADVMRLAAPERGDSDLENKLVIEKMIALEPKERTRKLIEMRLQNATYEQCAEELGYVSKERMRQIELRFIRESKTRMRRAESARLP